MARQTPGNYVPLDVNYARDVAIRKAGPGAELLYIRSLAYAKGSKTGGFVSVWDLDVVGIGLRANKLNAKRLVDVGLWERVEDGWMIRSWERWNANERIVSAGGKLGNHVRWHVTPGKFDPECEHCTTDGPIAPRSHPDRTPESPPESQGKGSKDKNPPTPLEGDPEPGPHPVEDVAERTEPEPDPFDDFWSAYPRKVSKPAARRAWASALKKSDPIAIMAGLERFRFSSDPQYVPHPATWLNQERWADEPSNVHPIRPGVVTSADGSRVKWVKPTATSRWREAYPDEVCVGMYKIQYVNAGEQPA